MPTIYGPLDIVKNELRNAVVQNLGSAPASPVKGLLYFSTADNTLYWYDGTQWIAAKAAAGAVPSDTVTTAAIGDAAVPGASTLFSRGDHKHGQPAFGTVTAQTSFGAASSNGVAATLPRSDHTHGTPVHDAAAHSTLLGAITAEQTFGAAKNDGVASTLARSDHQHGNPTHDTAAHSALLGAITAEQTFGAAKNDGVAGTLARSDHQHGNPLHDAAAHSAIPLSALAVPTAAVNLNSQKITNLASPTTATDAANKGYVDSTINGLSWKEPARVASTGNLALSGLTAIDGVTPIAGDRVLAKNQTTGSQNGIYTAASGAWTRAIDFVSPADALQAAVFVSEGTTQADTAWVMTTNAPITIDTTTLTWVQFGAPASYIGGAGLTLTGNTFDVGAGTGITVAADSVAVDTTVIATRAYVDSGIGATALTTAGNGLTKTGQTVDVVGGTGITVAADLVSVDTTVIATRAYVDAGDSNRPKKYAQGLAGSASPETITHNLNTREVFVQVLNGMTPYTAVMVDWDATTLNTVTVRYNPNLGSGYTIVVIG